VRRLLGHITQRLRHRSADAGPPRAINLWEPTHATARQLSAHGLDRWRDAAGVSWPGGVIECRRHLDPGAWADDVPALVLRGRPGSTIWRRMPRLCHRCRDLAAS
jgi:hypothetical protein